MKLKIQLVDEWRKFYAMYSVWFFAILGVMPDLYNLAVDNHLVDGGNAPAFLARVINVVAFAGAASRVVKQAVITKEAEKQATIRVERESQLLQKADELAAQTPPPEPVAPKL